MNGTLLMTLVARYSQYEMKGLKNCRAVITFWFSGNKARKNPLMKRSCKINKKKKKKKPCGATDNRRLHYITKKVRQF